MLEDEALSEHHLFREEPVVRFFAAMPLKSADDKTAGYLCIMSREPKELSIQQISSLRMLSRLAIKLMGLQSVVTINKKEKEKCLAETEEQNTIFYNAPDAVIVINNAGSIVQWNPKAERIFGWKKEEIIGRAFNETIIPEALCEVYFRKLKNYNEHGEKAAFSKTAELTALRKDKTIFDAALSISPTKVKDQQYFICFVSDITDRKLITTKLDNQKEFYENILNSIPTDIAVFSPDHKYLFVNPGAISNEELRKYIIGKDDFEYAAYRKRDMSIAETRRNRFLEIKENKKEIKWEDTLPDAAGNYITHMRRLFPVYNEQGELTMVIGYGIDITERKQMEVDLHKQNAQLIDFCNIVSHNLRAPLVNISMLVKFIEDSHDESEQKTMIKMLNPVIENLHNTFNELVKSIQVKESGEVECEKIIFEDCVERTMRGLDVEIKKLGAAIEMNFSKVPVINYPSKYIHSIVHNLLSNALKYHSPDRKPVIEIKATRKMGEEDTILFTIADNGLGIDLIKHGDSIFKIGKVFHRHPDAKGFGLFMTKTHVEAMGGKIWVESLPNEGTTFFIEFKNQKR